MGPTVPSGQSMHASQECDARLGYAYAFYAAVSSHRVMPRSMLQRPHPSETMSAALVPYLCAATRIPVGKGRQYQAGHWLPIHREGRLYRRVLY